MCHITLNKNAVVGDVSAMTPGGVRVGTPAMTSRGLKEQVRSRARPCQGTAQAGYALPFTGSLAMPDMVLPCHSLGGAWRLVRLSTARTGG